MLRSVEDRARQEREVRYLATEVEIREDGASGLTFDGIASVVDKPYAVRDIFGEYTETVKRGAWTKTLKEKSDVRLLVNHDGVPLARTKSGTLELSAAPDLRAVAPLDGSNPRVQEIRSAMARGDMDQMSVGMRVHRQEWNEDYTDRTILEAELFDVSIVTFPASPTTSASLRSIDELLTAEMDEDEIRRAIALLESRLPVPLVDFSVRDLADRDRLETIRFQTICDAGRAA